MAAEPIREQGRPPLLELRGVTKSFGGLAVLQRLDLHEARS